MSQSIDLIENRVFFVCAGEMKNHSIQWMRRRKKREIVYNLYVGYTQQAAKHFSIGTNALRENSHYLYGSPFQYPIVVVSNGNAL